MCWKENWGGGWLASARLGLAFGRRGNFNSPLSARGCSPLSPKGKASGVDCGGGEGWAWRKAVDCIGRVWFGACLWIASVRLGLARSFGLCRRGWLGARLLIVSVRLGLARSFGLCRRGWLGARLLIVSTRLDLRAAVVCGGGMTVMRRYRSCRQAAVWQEIPPQKGKSSKCCVEIICIRKQVTPFDF